MAGTIYIRQSSFADGDTITAALFNNEFNQLANAFAYTTSGTTGHTHDGTDGQGGNIGKIGDQDFKNKIVVDTSNNRWGVFVEVGGVTTEQVRIQDGAFVPVVDSDINLGSPTAYFKDSYIDTVTTTGAVTVGGALSAASFSIGGTALTATITELNTLDGITSTVTELNYTDGVTSNIQTQLNAKQPLDAQLTDIAALTPTDGTFIVGDGTNFVAEAPATALASLGVTSTATELNVLDGITATTTELNYVHNVTSPIQTQLNAKQALNAKLTDISNLTLSDNFFLVSTGANLALESPAAALTSLGVTATAAELNYVDGVTSNVQTQLDTKSPLSSPTFTGTLTAPIINASSDLKIGGTTIAATATELNYLSGVTSSVQTQLDALQASDTDLSAIAALTPSDGNFIVGNGTSWVAESGNTVIASLGVTATATELNYTDGVTSSIQTQLDSKAPTASPTFTGTVTIPAATVTGDISFGDNDKALFGSSSQLAIWSNGTNSLIQESGAGSLFVDATDIYLRGTGGTGTYLSALSGGSVSLYYNNSTKLSTSNTGATITGTVTADGLSLGDNDKATFGAGNDLEIYHDGSHSYIDDLGDGNLLLRTNGNKIALQDGSGNNMLQARTNGAVELAYLGVNKLATTSTGIDVTGTVTADDKINIDASNNSRLNIKETTSTDQNTQLLQTSGDLLIRTVNDAETVATNRIALDHATGDISFYEDTGTTPKFFWDASAESLGIGTSSPRTKLSVDAGAADAFLHLDTDSFTGTYASAINFSCNTVDATNYYQGQIGFRGENNYSGHLFFSTSNSGTTNAVTERMRIDASGELTTTNGKVNLITVGRGAGAVASNTAVGLSALAANTSGVNNTAHGYQSLASNTTGNDNTANGIQALYSNTTGANNTATGLSALYTNTTGSNNTATGRAALFANTAGNSNSAYGYEALFSNTTASQNTATGFQSLRNNTTGTNHVATGYQALFNNTTGALNVATGVQALHLNTTGSDNVAIGAAAMYANTTGFQNTAIGRGVLNANTTALSNTGIGHFALLYNTTGSNNTATGTFSLYSNTTASNNVANGMYALYSNTTGSSNTGIGYQAGYSNTTGASNTKIGHQAGYNNTTGSTNTALGVISLYANTTGSFNVAIGGGTAGVFQGALTSNTTGSYNTATGVASLGLNTTGSYNTATGYQSLYSNTTASQNTAHGYQSLYSNTTGNYNTATGLSALSSNTTASNNTAYGFESLYSNTTGVNNTATGWRSLYSNTTANNNAAYGYGSLYSNTTGTQNTASGTFSLYANSTGIYNTAHGYAAMYSNTTGGSNVAVGMSALYLNTTANNNVGVGYAALYTNTTGADNVAVGRGSLFYNTTGTGNVANGFQALFLNTTGNQNTATGYEALRANTTGVFNSANGYQALEANTTGTSNTASGYLALHLNTTGDGNTAFGRQSLYSNTAGVENVAVGRSALYYTTGSGNIGLGFRNSGGSYAPVFDPTTESNRVVMGHTSVTNAYVQVAWTVVSDARDKMNFAPVPHGLDFVKQLDPVAYQFKIDRDTETPNGNVRYGFKAQDILALEGDNPVIIDNEDEDKLKYNGESLVPVLVKAMQEQQAIIESLTNRIAALEGN